jgi:hypothetical protein
MFSSRKSSDLPWRPGQSVTVAPVLDGTGESVGSIVTRVYTQHNEPNPILVKFRSIPEDSREAWHHGFLAAAERVLFAPWTDEQADHARRVLDRLARLQAEVTL